MRREGHGAHAHGQALAAHFGEDLVPYLGVVRWQISHGNRLVDGGRQGAAGHAAEFVAVGVKEGRAFTHGHTFQANQAHAFAGCCACQMGFDHLGTGVTPRACATRASHFLDGPVQARFNG